MYHLYLIYYRQLQFPEGSRTGERDSILLKTFQTLLFCHFGRKSENDADKSGEMLWPLSVLLHCFIADNTASVSWIESSTKLPDASSGFAAGYDQNNDRIWLLGMWVVHIVSSCTFYILYTSISYCTSFSFECFCIKLGGAQGSGNDVLSLDIDTSSFTVHSSLPIDIGEAPYTTANGTIFIVHSNVSDSVHSFAAFSMESSTFLFPWNGVSIPSEYEEGCLTSYQDRYLLYLGGCIDCIEYDSPEYSDQILIYDLWSSEWLPRRQTMTFGRSRFGCAIHDDYLYIAGGEWNYFMNANEPGYTSNIERLYIGDLGNLEHYDWQTLFTMEEHKVWTQPVVVDDIIFMIGTVLCILHRTPNYIPLRLRDKPDDVQ